MTDFDTFWKQYPKKVGKGAAQKSWDKISSDDRKLIIPAIEAQKRYRTEATKAGEFVPVWANPSTWLNQMRWLDEIPSHSALKEKVKLQSCQTRDCNNPVYGQRFTQCESCLLDSNKSDWRYSLLLAEWERLGKPRTKDECRPILAESSEKLKRRLHAER